MAAVVSVGRPPGPPVPPRCDYCEEGRPPGVGPGYRRGCPKHDPAMRPYEQSMQAALERSAAHNAAFERARERQQARCQTKGEPMTEISDALDRADKALTNLPSDDLPASFDSAVAAARSAIDAARIIAEDVEDEGAA